MGWKSASCPCTTSPCFAGSRLAINVLLQAERCRRTDRVGRGLVLQEQNGDNAVRRPDPAPNREMNTPSQALHCSNSAGRLSIITPTMAHDVRPCPRFVTGSTTGACGMRTPFQPKSGSHRPAIFARLCHPKSADPEPRQPSTLGSSVSDFGRSSSLRASSFEKASVVPSSRLMTGCSITVTGFFVA